MRRERPGPARPRRRARARPTSCSDGCGSRAGVPRSKASRCPNASRRTMNAEDLILISVDDHICEPADMFDAHVPERYREQAPRVVTDAEGGQQWWYGDVKGR